MKKQKGFTLLELLVVIGIIALVLSAVTISYSSAQGRSRDARRREDLKAMQGALEQYYAANNGVYPNTPQPCSTAASYGGTQFINGTWPSADPQGTAYAASCTGTQYCICADIEADNGNSTTASCGWAATGGYYCVKNMQ